MNASQNQNTVSSQRREATMTRRGIVAGTALLSSVTLINDAFAQGSGEHNHAPGKYQSLIESSHHCAMTGQVCLSHCFETFKTGDTTLAECAVKVQELTVVCQALAQLAANESPHVASLAKLTIEVCNDCEAECRKHAEHVQCANCADACAACREECEKVAA